MPNISVKLPRRIKRLDNKRNFTVPEEELEKQKEYSKLVSLVLSSRFPNSAPKAFVHTYGCQGNVSDGEKIKGILCSLGYELTESLEEADLVLYNTCAIREHAQDRVFGNVGALKKYKTAKAGNESFLS